MRSPAKCDGRFCDAAMISESCIHRDHVTMVEPGYNYPPQPHSPPLIPPALDDMWMRRPTFAVPAMLFANNPTNLPATFCSANDDADGTNRYGP